jgi:large subunit ribosomal protein L28
MVGRSLDILLGLPGTSWASTCSMNPIGVSVASVCDVCGKGPGFGNNVSHSHRRTRRRWNPNIQTVRAAVGRTTKRLNVCTSCIKAGKVTRAV